MDDYPIFISNTAYLSLIGFLEELTNTRAETFNAFDWPDQLIQPIRIPASKPSLLILSRNENGWLNIHHNAGRLMEEWGPVISERLSCLCLQVYSTEEYSRLLLHQNGNRIREIIRAGKTDTLTINFGDLLPFESGNVKGPETLSDFDSASIHEYCLQLGIDTEYIADSICYIFQ